MTHHDILPVNLFLFGIVFRDGLSLVAHNEGFEESGLLADVDRAGSVREPSTVRDRLCDHAIVSPADDKRTDDNSGRNAQQENEGRCFAQRQWTYSYSYSRMNMPRT